MVPLTPIYSTVAHEKMAAATLLTPNRGCQAHCPVGMLLNLPAGAGLRQQIQFDDVLATARAQHGGGPEIVILAGEVDVCRDKPIRNVLDPDVVKQLRLAPWQHFGCASRQ